MLTKLIIRNFKAFNKVEIDLGNPVVFIGPNNSGKTTALQALALWEIGLNRWVEKRKSKTAAGERSGAAINRRDLIAVPVPNAKLLWHDLHVRDVQRVNEKPQTQNVRVEIIVEGVAEGKQWTCGLEFDYANEESFYCRPLRLTEGEEPERMPVPDEASDVHMAFLPPMSGLAANETRLDHGAINVRLGEGRTAEVLRNLCFQIIIAEDGGDRWKKLCKQIQTLFGVMLDEPTYIQERGEVAMTYRHTSRTQLDLSSSGRGLQQTLLLLAYLATNPRSVLLLDEPDAHLEILRQRQIYQLLTETAREQNSQIIIASHSEVILNEAADRDVVVAFVGKPHRIDDRGSQLLKSLKEIGYDQFYQAEQTGWVLYLEGSTDLAILKAFAEQLNHPVQEKLARVFVRYVENQPHKARDHFRGLREASPTLIGFTLCDRVAFPLQPTAELQEYQWKRREIENYICQPETLLAYAEGIAKEWAGGPLFERSEIAKNRQAMQECIDDLIPRAAMRDRNDPWWSNTKASDEFLDRLFELFFAKLQLPNMMRKSDYHVLVRYVPKAQIDPEVPSVLDTILRIAEQAKPVMQEESE